ncbi:MAG: hypothetical protein JST22_14485 [Bacteroidetes bacterium]|nr:hypothetical protein [Bacteroidota bacterium]
MSSTTSFSANSVVDLPYDDGATLERFETWLRGVVEANRSHARLANTLSMLEHIGSVKIARSQAGRSITLGRLQHLTEETRHAWALKRIAVAVDPDGMAQYNEAALLAGAAARGYFERLDAGVRNAVREALPGDLQNEAAYLLVTWLVELRAAWLYPVYQSALEACGARHSVRSIIGDEARHLDDVRQGLDAVVCAASELPEMLRRYEAGLFERLAAAMMRADAASVL